MASDPPALPSPWRVVAIDGPVASGKTALGLRLAQRLGWRFLDTGIMYRALTWLALERAIDLRDDVALAGLAESAGIALGDPPGGSREPTAIWIDCADATPHLREAHVDASVSTVAAVAGVRQVMVERQREIACRGAVVMAGRDIGTVVAPDAGVKIFLDASPEVRAQRRASEIRQAGRDVTDSVVLAEIRRRDARDAGRLVSPLRAAHDAVRLDTSALDLDEAVATALAIVAARLPGDVPP